MGEVTAAIYARVSTEQGNRVKEVRDKRLIC
jgi:hypothetical protein